MHPACAPRHYTLGPSAQGDHATRVATRQAFVALKSTFLEALRDTSGTEWLRRQVRSSEQPVDLWLLRAPVFAALAGADAGQRERRHLLRRGLDSMFLELDCPSGFSPL